MSTQRVEFLNHKDIDITHNNFYFHLHASCDNLLSIKFYSKSSLKQIEKVSFTIHCCRLCSCLLLLPPHSKLQDLQLLSTRHFYFKHDNNKNAFVIKLQASLAMGGSDEL